jgi:methylated-DNA-[protein]-cysteine S-methyltransferase
VEICSFASELGWMAMVASDAAVEQLVFGYPSAAAALAALDGALAERAVAGDGWSWLVERLQDFAAGRRVDFDDVAIDLAHLGPFQRRVVEHCRAIRYGRTASYGQLAALAGSPRAARAVGTTMATNRFALIVPCHRVISADGSSGHYGAPGGRSTKERLLDMERRAVEFAGGRESGRVRGASTASGRKIARISREN